MPLVPGISIPQPLLKPNRGLPAQGLEARHVQQLAWGAVRLAGVEVQPPPETDDAGDGLRQFADGHVRAAADIDVGQHGPGVGLVACRLQFHDMDASGGHVIDVEEFPPRGAAAPDGHLVGAGLHGLVEAPQQGGDDVGILRVIVIAGAIEIGGHDAAVVAAMLAVVALAQLDAGDLGDGVGLVGGL